MPTPTTLTATVTATGTTTPVGSVQFYDGETPIGSPVPVVNGVASTPITLTTSWTPTSMVLDMVTQVGLTGVYHYTSYTGMTPVVGMCFAFAGFPTGSNNRNGILTAFDSVAQTVTIANNAANTETHAGTGVLNPVRQGKITNGGDVFSSSPWINILPTDTVAGNILLVWSATKATGSASFGISDTAGHTWISLTTLLGGFFSTNEAASAALWYAVAKGGPTTITVTEPGSTHVANCGFANASEWQGPLVLDQNASFFIPPNGSNPQTGPTIVTAFDDEALAVFYASTTSTTSANLGLVSASTFPPSGEEPVDGVTTPCLYLNEATAGTSVTPAIVVNSSGTGCAAVATSWARQIQIPSTHYYTAQYTASGSDFAGSTSNIVTVVVF